MLSQVLDLMTYVEWFLIPLALAVVRLWFKFTALDKSLALLEQRVARLDESNERTKTMVYQDNHTLTKLRGRVDNLEHQDWS